MTSVPGLFVAGEAGWAYHGANRLGANSLLSACVDGWFTLPFSVPNYLSGQLGGRLPGAQDACVIRAGGHVAVDAGTAQDADALPISTDEADEALDFAACIGCGACVAACPNGSAHLFAGAKLTHLALLPIPAVERSRRAKHLVAELEDQFGPCSLFGEYAQVCPAGIPLAAIAAVNKERVRAGLRPSHPSPAWLRSCNDWRGPDVVD